MTAPTADGFTFPGEYCGQYGVYEAVRHLYSQSKELRPLLKEESLYVNKKFFAGFGEYYTFAVCARVWFDDYFIADFLFQ